MPFSAKTEDLAFARANGQCEECGGQLKPGKYHFDHRKPRGLGGDDSAENCQVLCVRCHLEKTVEDVSPMRKADRKAKAKRPLEVAKGLPEIARRFKK